ncbi:DNA mismatch repair protein msh7 [Asimina triloba]
MVFIDIQVIWCAHDHDVKDSDAETLSVLVELPVIVHTNSTSMFSSLETGGPILKIKSLWHPYAIGGNGGEPVPNDIYLGEGTTGYCPRSLLLTGPNMGGKSTLLRAICLAVVMAQLGCYVPCEMCVLSPVDIIFTRLGATDRIMMGEREVEGQKGEQQHQTQGGTGVTKITRIRGFSRVLAEPRKEGTFFIECSETASVLQNATQDSLVLLDELGRGTSTFDGYAIAYAVFRHLVEKVHCRLLFATHYHPLTKEFASHPRVSLQHMACAFNQRNGSAFTGDQELVFLYKLTLGPCPESYGLQVALMAGIPKHVVQAASKASKALRRSIGENFRSSEVRSEFSTLHEEWLRTVLAVSMTTNDSDLNEDDSDTLLLLWHELKRSYALLEGKE